MGGGEIPVARAIQDALRSRKAVGNERRYKERGSQHPKEEERKKARRKGGY